MNRYHSDIIRDMQALEAKQLRPMRELLADPSNAPAQQRLAALEEQLAVLREEYAQVGMPEI